MDALLTPVAAACYPLGALLNHSCDPTCVAAYDYVRGSDSPDGPEKDAAKDAAGGGFWRQAFRCARAVRRGEELTHAYVDASDLPVERRDSLLKTYGFACDCARCPPMGEGPFSMGERGSAEEDASIEAAAELLRRAAEAEAVDEERALAESALAALGGAEGDVRDDDVGITFDDVRGDDATDDDDDESDARVTVFSGRRGKRGSPSALAAWRVKALDLAAHAAMLAGDWPAASRRFEALVPRRVAACGSRFHPRVALDLVTLRAVLAQAEEGVGGAVEEEKSIHKKKEKVEEATRDALDVLRVVAGEASELFVDTKREAAAGR
jgi:SET and MYND domain-containing protein